ncbi:anti-sigma regulatory factor (Ser/Thr protein kinase) [Lipingzhangella halophila]|uniref:Anti-sigma regulatory factor (Ser/Thr protein kinase) n=1 Tax=Lipingzhangella halophila TaxID=1783352 RepID=A0A7W7W0K8_9ACTN|nr:ATP-binding protein [Lipingzhangella halophila]MBB4930012.1 anti-sigma regulatory factor (Ser/Thr protein kinase) [Lipingzhangella halophila]
MSIVPHTPSASVRSGRRWASRLYSGDLAQTSRVRADLRADLAGFGDDLVETATLCASEAFANAVEHTGSGEPGGRVLRALYVAAPGTLRLVIVDDGAVDTAPEVPHQRTDEQWRDAERGRGLLLVESIAASWGTFPVVPFPFCTDLGTAVWAEFPTGDAPFR